MNEAKRERARAIIISDNKIVSMYRERDGRIFYTFPGGGMEEGETEQDCVAREVLEEFGLIINPIKKVYIYESERSIEYFYLCDWVDGKFGTGEGEEFQPENNNGIYKPVFIEISKIPSLPLMPPDVAAAFYEDYGKNGKTLRSDIKIIKV